MRRMEKDAACSGGEAGGPLSKPHAAVKSGTTLLQTLRRSAVTQFVWHHCDINTALMASTPG